MGTLPLTKIEITGSSTSDPEQGDTEDSTLQNTTNTCLDKKSSINRHHNDTRNGRWKAIKEKILYYRYPICTILFIIQTPLLLYLLSTRLFYNNDNNNKQTNEETTILQKNETTQIPAKHPSSQPYKLANCVQTKPPTDEHENINENFTRFMPGWSAKTKDFCHGSEFELLVADDQILGSLLSQEIACPEKISALEISTSVTAHDVVVLLRTFCRVRKLTFLDSDVCDDNDDAHDKTSATNQQLDVGHYAVKANSLKIMKFERLSNCGSLYDKIVSTIWAPYLQAMIFKCVQFTNTDFDLLSNFVSLSAAFQTIFCSDANLCDNLQFIVDRKINFVNQRISC